MYETLVEKSKRETKTVKYVQHVKCDNNEAG
jgi:hypothetical protein